MPYIAYNTEKYLKAPLAGKMVGTGQCVALVHDAANTGAAAYWKEGSQVAGNLSLQKGTIIATFQNGNYNNRTNGDSHAAIYLKQDVKGLWVIDQWKNSHSIQPPHIRHILFRHGSGTAANDGNAYSVVEQP